MKLSHLKKYRCIGQFNIFDYINTKFNIIPEKESIKYVTIKKEYKKKNI